MLYNQDENQMLNETTVTNDQKTLEPGETPPVQNPPPSKYTYKYGYGYYEPAPLPMKTRQPAITYIFVTSLIMMIILALRTITSLDALANYNEALDYLVTTGQPQYLIDGFKAIMYTTYFSVLSLLSCAVGSLLLLIYSCKARNRQNPRQVRAKTAKIIKIVAIVFLIALCSHLILEFATYATVMDFADTTGIITFDVELLESSLQSSFIVLGTFIGLQIAGIVKSCTYSEYINNVKE